MGRAGRRRGLQYCTPAWMLGWWEPRPAEARLEVAVAYNGAELVGIAPCYTGAEHCRYIASARVPRLPPNGAAARAAGASVRWRPCLRLPWRAPAPAWCRSSGCRAARASWPDLMAAGRPGRLRAGRRMFERFPAPLLTLTDQTYERWLSGRSSNFRSQMRRARRSLEERGATVRLAATPSEMDADLRAFIRLHHARWDPRGGCGGDR